MVGLAFTALQVATAQAQVMSSEQEQMITTTGGAPEKDASAGQDGMRDGQRNGQNQGSMDAGSMTSANNNQKVEGIENENTAGDITPRIAADMAAAMGITVYTIGAGTNGWAPTPVQNLFGQTVMRNQRVQIDEKTLQEIADITDGKYFRATDTESLEEIYAKIDEMERTEITQRTYVNHVDMAVQSVALAGFTVPPLLFVAFMFLLGDLFLRSTFYRIVD